MPIVQKGVITFTFWLIYSSLLYASSPLAIEIRTIGFAPYGINSNGKLSGIYYELANKIVTDAGYISQNTVTPYARIIRELKLGKTDMTIMFRYPELEDYVEYVAPLPPLKTVVIGLKGTHFLDSKDLNGKKLVYLRGAKFSDEIDNNDAIIKYQTTDFLQGIKMLLAGRADAIIGPLDPILSAALQIKGPEIQFGEPLVVDQRTPWIQVSNKNKLNIDINKLKESFLELQKQDMLNTLRAKYLQQTQ